MQDIPTELWQLLICANSGVFTIQILEHSYSTSRMGIFVPPFLYIFYAPYSVTLITDWQLLSDRRDVIHNFCKINNPVRIYNSAVLTFIVWKRFVNFSHYDKITFEIVLLEE